MSLFARHRLRTSVALVLTTPLLLAGAPDSAGAESDVIVAETCEATDVQAALNATPDGGTVEIPAGDCDWGDVQVSRAGGVTMIGAGAGAGGDQTIIRRTAPVTEFLYALLEIDCSNGKTVEISGIAMVGNDDLQNEEQRLADQDVGLSLRNRCTDFEVHDSTFAKFSHAGLSVEGHAVRGVISDSEFISNYKCQEEPVDCLGYGVLVFGDPNRRRPKLALGTRNAVYIEDSYFYDNRHAIASNHGSRYVARYNDIVATQRTRDFGMLDAHGRADRHATGSRSWEFYENVLRTDPPTMVAAGIYTRGGDGVVFNNHFSQIPWVILLGNERCPAHRHYPLRDQTTEAYVWDNDWEAIPGYGDEPVQVPEGCERYIKEGRDYFQFARPGYTPYAYPHPLR